RGWWIGFLAGFMMLQILAISVCWLFYMGVGIWGINVPVAWGFAIINFVWWIGIGHAGTLISAILLLLHQKWRTSINRFSEAMTIFAVMCAGMFPLLHMGRPWFFYWLYPFPNVAGVWPQFRSPLTWDVFAVTTYFTVSLVFWYVGLIPDLCGKVMVATGMLVCYVYFSEFWMEWYGHTLYEWGTTIERMFGPYLWSYWILLFCNLVVPQLLWSMRVRRNGPALFWISIFV